MKSSERRLASFCRISRVTGKCVIGRTLTAPEASSERWVSTSNQRSDSMVSPKSSTRNGFAVLGGKRSRIPPRNASSPGSPTRSVRTKPFSTRRSSSARMSSSSPSASRTMRRAKSSVRGSRAKSARTGTMRRSTPSSTRRPRARISSRITPSDGATSWYGESDGDGYVATHRGSRWKRRSAASKSPMEASPGTMTAILLCSFSWSVPRRSARASTDAPVRATRFSRSRSERKGLLFATRERSWETTAIKAAILFRSLSCSVARTSARASTEAPVTSTRPSRSRRERKGWLAATSARIRLMSFGLGVIRRP